MYANGNPVNLETILSEYVSIDYHSLTCEPRPILARGLFPNDRIFPAQNLTPAALDRT
jgi:hypothetical protein